MHRSAYGELLRGVSTAVVCEAIVKPLTARSRGSLAAGLVASSLSYEYEEYPSLRVLLVLGVSVNTSILFLLVGSRKMYG